ncbi:MAG: ATP-binding cassette domain-containing protein [Synergistaceae bacterium]|nr:ATP-binding cassette domain-containing protein [Synergistaceae bacterium]
MSLIVDIKKRLGDFFLDVSFDTNGGVSGLLGASGSGKSVTLMCIAGILKPDSGKIILNGTALYDSERRIDLTPQRRRVGYLFQNYALFPDMSVRQNILCGLRNEKDKSKKERSLLEIIEMMQLRGLENHRPGQLSGGQQQRAALARILVGDPELLMLDEPFSALDTNLRGQLQIEIQKLLKRFGKDTLLVTHSRDEAYHLCGEIALLDSGKIIARKETKQIFADPESRQAAYLTGCKNVVDAKKSGEYEVDVPDWGLRFTTSQPVRDGLCAIGVRAHYFNPKTIQNRFPVRLTDKIEGPFEFNVQFRYKGQVEGSQDIWWLLPKEKMTEQFPESLGVSPANIMLLYG